jgi:hypothetical protein
MPLAPAAVFRKSGKHPYQFKQKEAAMQIDKSQILEFLRSQGDHEKADRAGSELPDQVDTEQHGDLLSKLGINPADLMGKLPGGLGDKLGGLGL